MGARNADVSKEAFHGKTGISSLACSNNCMGSVTALKRRKNTKMRDAKSSTLAGDTLNIRLDSPATTW